VELKGSEERKEEGVRESSRRERSEGGEAEEAGEGEKE
jgi:hypothetical protein